jgi:methane monooxygenase component A beta chain/propane monooxygenase small subunit
VTTHETAEHHKDLVGNRQFTWFTPAKRKPTEYESYTVGQYSSPDQWMDVGWPLRFDDGAEPWSHDYSKVKTTRWADYRDPFGVWQRPFVSQTNQDQQSLARLVPVLVHNSAAATSSTWTDNVLAKTYAAWPFVEYGLFLSLAYAIRQAMSDTAQFATVFQAVDRLRLLQDIVLHLDHLTEETGFSDAGARDAWMSDPTLVPIRELVEHIYASEDWVEIVVVTTLVFEPIVGRLAKAELFTKRATLAGDATTPLVIAGALRDNERHVETVQALVQHLIADPETGAANAEIIRGWIAEWTPRAEAAAKALLPVLESAGEDAQTAADALARIVTEQNSIVEAAGVKA